MKTLLYNPIFVNPLAYYVFPRLSKYLQPDNESTSEPANYIGSIEVRVIAYGDTKLKKTYMHTSEIDLSEFKESWIRISLFTKAGSCVLGEWKIGTIKDDLPYIDPEVLASLKAVVVVGDKTNQDSDRATVKNLVDSSNPFIISNAAYKLNSGYGKYAVDFLKFIKDSESDITFSSDKFVVNGKINRIWIAWVITSLPGYTVKISGINPNGSIIYAYSTSGTYKLIVAKKNGIYTLPASDALPSIGIGFQVSDPTLDWSGLTIEQIPDYQGAFVTDGVDDMIMSSKTVREMLGDSNDITVVSMIRLLYSVYSSSNYSFTNYIKKDVKETYIRNYVGNAKDKKLGIYGYFKKSNNWNVINGILGDKNDYMFQSNNQSFESRFSVEGYIADNDNVVEPSQLAWYWTVIANKALTTDQINQVIAYYNLDRYIVPDVLYDVKRQGITNDNHTLFGDKLIDYSGNGHDMLLYNIGWEGSSGVGNYAEYFKKNRWFIQSLQTGIINNNTSVKVVGKLTNFYIIYHRRDAEINAFKVKITNLRGTIRYSYITRDEERVNIYIKNDGVYDLPASISTEKLGSSSEGFYFVDSHELDWIGLTIEILPSNENSICFDGVDDHGKVTGLPVYKDYTIIANRKFIGERRGAVASKAYALNSGSFYFESGESIASFGKITNLDIKKDTIISYLSKYIYNGELIPVGSATDSDAMWIGTIRDNYTSYSNIALYSLLLFPYSMSEFLIERQLKKYNLGTLHPTEEQPKQ